MAKTIKAKTRGRKPNSAWEGVFRFGGQMFSRKTDGEIVEYLSSLGFKTSRTNVFLMRKRWEKKGKAVNCPRSQKKKKKNKSEILVNVVEEKPEETTHFTVNI